MLARDLFVAGERWSKGRRLSRADLDAFTTSPPSAIGAVTVIVLEDGDLHEDDAARRLAAAVAGPGLTSRGPVQSRVDLVAPTAGVVHVRTADLERLNRLDPLEVFTRLDGSIVEAGDLVASVKVAPHVVSGAVVDEGVRLVRDGARPVVRVARVRAAGRGGRREGVPPARGPAAVRGERPGEGREPRVADHRDRLRRRRGRGGPRGARPRSDRPRAGPT